MNKNSIEGKYGIAVKAIIIHNLKVLIIKRHSEDKYKPDEFDLPGGRLKFGEQAEEALKREVKEETGLEIEVLKPSKIWNIMTDDIEQIIGITFLTEACSDKVKLSGEHQDFKWVDFDRYDNINIPSWLKL